MYNTQEKCTPCSYFSMLEINVSVPTQDVYFSLCIAACNVIIPECSKKILHLENITNLRHHVMPKDYNRFNFHLSPNSCHLNLKT